MVISINIVDVNEPPVWVNLPGTIQLSEDMVTAQAVFTLQTTDQDAGATTSYSMTTVPAVTPFTLVCKYVTP